MNGEHVKLTPQETRYFKQLASYYREYRSILESVEASEFNSLQDLGHAVRYGKLKESREQAVQFVNECFDVNRGELAQRLLQATLGAHLVNLSAFELLTLERQVLLLQDALEMSRRRRLSGYQAGAFVIGSLVRGDAPVRFWKSFDTCQVAALLNEWILHQKYLTILNDLGERRLSRAKEHILSEGLGRLQVNKGLVSGLVPLKLSGMDLDKVKRDLPDHSDPQTAEVIELLSRPFGEFYDFSKPWDMAELRRLCEAEGVPLPSPQDR